MTTASTDRSTDRPLRTAAVLTLGCKLNQAESEAIARELALAGWRVVDRPAAADAYVINSCSVTHVADRKSRHLVRLAKRLAPDAPVALTGCYPETAGAEIARATGADIVVPSRDKAAVVAKLLEAADSGQPAMREDAGDAVSGQRKAGGSALPVARPLRTRAFVKAQEGCNDVCAFCIVPRTRGRERSIAPEEVAAVVAERERDGAQEVVITGTQLGAYGRDRDPDHYGPAAVIRAVLAETAAPRIRFSSLQPQDITPELLALWEDPRLCRHFHLALQSGSDGVLRRMRRRYTIDRFREALARIREAIPEAAITTDIIVGFPGETEAEAAESLAFCREAGFALMHVFPYSRRPGTTAHLMTGHVPDPVKRARMEAMLALAGESAAAWRRRFLGRVLPVLWEAPVRPPRARPDADEHPSAARRHGVIAHDTVRPSLWEGLTDTYVRVFARSDADLRNRILPTRLISEADDGVWGDLDAGAAPVAPHHLPARSHGAGEASLIPLTVVERR